MLRNVCIIFVAVALTSCNSSSLVGRRVDNFTAYYNTFYNAERVFSEAERSLEIDDPKVNREVFIDIYTIPERIANRQNFENSIKKSADILREHENSKWIDDALLLIGKSYFYTENYVSAQRYFQDVIDVSDRLDGDAQAWLGRTFMASGLYDEAIQHLTETLASEDLSRKSEPVLHLQLGNVYVKTGEYESARDELVQGIRTVKDKDLRARAQYLLGQVFETLGDRDSALEAYRKAGRYTALYELSFAGQFKTVELLAESDPEGAQKLLRRMERDDKNFSYSAKLALLRGRVLATEGKYTEAESFMLTSLKEAIRIDPEAVGQTHYELGKLYQYNLVDYSRAAVHYDTAATNLKSSIQKARIAAIRSKIDQPFAAGAVVDAEDKAETFGAFAIAYQQVALYDSLLALGELDEEAFDIKIQELRRQRLEEMEEQRRESERRAIEQQFRNSGGATSTNIERETAKSGDSSGGEDGFSNESGFLNHKDPIRMRAGVQNFIELWGTRPLVDNWRIESVLVREAAKQEGNSDDPEDGVVPITLGNIEFLPTIDVSDVPRTPNAKVKVRGERAEARYSVGNVLFLSMGSPDSASYWYNLVVEEDAEFEVSERAFFAMTEAARAAGNTAEAERLESQLLARFPDSEFARRIRGEDVSVLDEIVEDSLSIQLLTNFNQARATWLDAGNHEQAYVDMLAVAHESQDSVLTPRALYASTMIYRDWAWQNNQNPLDPISFVRGDSLLAELGIGSRVSELEGAQLANDSLSVEADVRSDSVSIGIQEVGSLTEADSLAEADSAMEPDSLMEADSLAQEGSQLVSATADSMASDSTAAAIQQIDPLATEVAEEVVSRSIEKVVEVAGSDSVRIDPEQLDGGSLDALRDSSSARFYYLADIFQVIRDRYPDTEYAAETSRLVLELDPTLPEGLPVVDNALPNRERRDADDTSDQESDTSESRVAPGVENQEPVDNQRKPVDERTEVAERELESNSDQAVNGENTDVEPDLPVASSEDIESEPALIGGIEQLKSRVRFPEEVGDFPDGGTVMLEFVVSADGFVTNPVVLVGMNEDFDREALRVIRETRFRPAINTTAQPVPYKMQFDIEFTPLSSTND